MLHVLNCSKFEGLVVCIFKHSFRILKQLIWNFLFFILAQTSQRHSTANLPLSISVKRSTSCHSFSHPQSRSTSARSLSRAASEISEIEYIDITDHNEPSLDNIADQQTLDNLEKELSVLRNSAGNAIFFHCRQCEVCLLPDSPYCVPRKHVANKKSLSFSLFEASIFVSAFLDISWCHPVNIMCGCQSHKR